MSLLPCCAGSRRQKHAKSKTSNSPGSQRNGQTPHHDDVTGTSGLTRTPSLHNYGALTSSDDDQRTVTSHPVSGDATASNSTSFNRWTSPQPRDTTTTAAVKGQRQGAMYSPDDYDNTAGTGDDNGEQRPSGTTTSTRTRTKIKSSSSDEQSLDQLVAHLLGEVSPPPSSSAQQQPGGSAWTALRWPQGDSLPRVEMRRAGHYDVPESKDLLSLADENDNIIKHDDSVVTSSPVTSSPVTSPPLLTVRKKATSPLHHSTLEEVVSELSMAASGFEVLEKEEKPRRRQRGHDDTVSSNHGGDADAELASQTGQRVRSSETERIHSTASAGAENEASPDAASSDRDSCSVTSFDVQRTSLMDQFKALRLQVLTSTSQLLSCVSGTWKRGESFRSKLTTIMQLCLALRTSVGRLETFLQSALQSAAGDSPLVETANTRVKNLQAVQTSIDAYIETLDVENLSGGGGVASTQDLKVGGIIHLTKEIPGLVRTFAPVIEHLAAKGDAATPPLPGTAAGPHPLDTSSSDTTSQTIHRQQHFVVDTTPLDSGTQAQNDREKAITDHDNDVEPNLPAKHSDVVTAVEPATVESVQNEQAKNVAAHQQDRGTTTDNESAPVFYASGTTSTEQTKISAASSVRFETTPTTSGTPDLPPVFTPTVSGGERAIRQDVSLELTSQESVVLLPGVLSAQTESSKPPTPPPKLRVASQYHASLGISNSLTACATTTATTSTTTTTTTTVTTTRRYVEDAVASMRSEGRRDVATDDRLIQHSGARLDGSASDVLTIMKSVTGSSGSDDVLAAAADTAYFKFPRAGVETPPPPPPPQLEPVVLRKHQDPETESRVSESELETPDFRASGVSQTMVDQLEALQRQAAAQTVVMHTDTAAGFDFDTTTTTSPSPHQQQSTLSAEDRRLLMFYCDQMTGHWKVLDNAASAFFHCIDRRQPPKVFVSHSKFVLVAGRKIAYVGDVLARNIEDDNAHDWIVAHSNRLCNSLKMAARSTKEAALAYPAVPEQQLMVDCVKEVTDWAIELKEVVDRLAYIGRPDHVLV